MSSKPQDKQPNNPHAIAPSAGGIPPAVPQERKTNRLRHFSVFFWGVALIVVLAVGLSLYFLMGHAREPFTGPTFVAAKQKLLVTIVERGSLESAENSDIVVRVKAPAKGSTNSSTIKWVIDDGSQVKAGDLIVELDDSGFQDTLKTQKNTVNKAYSDYVQARNDSIIQSIQNVSDIKTAEVTLLQKDLELKKYAGELPATKLTRLETQDDLRKYLTADFENEVRKESANSNGKFTSAYLQDINDNEGKIETARSDKESWLDRAAWSQRMVKKGFYSPSQSDADQSRLASMEITLRKVVGDLDIYRKFELEKNVTTRWSDVKEAERALKRVKIQAESKIEQKKADEVSKKAILDQELDRLHDMEKEEKNYKIHSPQDGMVVYFVPEQSRGGSGSQQSIVAQGEPVREGQKLMRVPNLAKMLVNARVHEAMVSKLKGEVTKPTGYGDSLRIGFSLGRLDLLSLLSYHAAFEELHEKFRDKELNTIYSGQPAAIRVDAYPGKQYYGRVKTVAAVASQADWLSSDVKVYQTMVSIENTVENLRPGMSAEVTILADETPDAVLVIPIQAVVGNVAMGAKRKCWVLDAKGFAQERDIEVGMSNDKFVEIRSGVEEGQKVVINPRPLIPEKSDMKPGTPGTRRVPEFEEGAAKKSGKKKGDGGMKGGDPTGMPPGPGQGPGGKSFQSSDNTPRPQERATDQTKKGPA